MSAYTKMKQGEFRTPDLFLSRGGGPYEIVVECKASRMNFRTRFSHVNDLGAEGFEEMTKAVFQIWRHAFHSRLGIAEPKLAKDATGLVLTLDAWFQAGIKRQELVLSEARQLLIAKFPDAKDCDQIPIAFTNMTELENVLRTGTSSTVIDAIRIASSSEKRGWSLDSIHNDLAPEGKEYSGFAFEKQLGDILPFWAELREEAAKRCDRNL